MKAVVYRGDIQSRWQQYTGIYNKNILENIAMSYWKYSNIIWGKYNNVILENTAMLYWKYSNVILEITTKLYYTQITNIQHPYTIYRSTIY